MDFKTLIVAAALVGVAAPLASADYEGCQIQTRDAIQVGDYYMVGTAWEFWEESNGVPGLQRSASSCPGYDIPSDTCITHHENWGLVECLITYPSTV